MEFGEEEPKWVEYKLLVAFPHISHGTFLRHGGASPKPFGALNASIKVGDHLDSVLVNRERISKALNIPKIVYAKSNHGAKVERITRENIDTLGTCDALFTTEKNLGLAITHADCQAAIFYDPEHEAVGVVHSGWKGSVQNIYAQMIHAMIAELGTNPQKLVVCISASLGPDHAEFKNYKKEFPEEFWVYQKKPNYFDFWAISKKQLISCGVLEKNIEVARVCTYSNPKDYFSYRRDTETGRHATVVALSRCVDQICEVIPHTYLNP